MFKNIAEIEKIQQFCRDWINQKVDTYFSGDIESANRDYVKNLLIHKDDDTFDITIAKLLLKNEITNQLNDKILGMPSIQFNQNYYYNPNIILKFREIDAPKDRKDRLRVQISFQIPNGIYTENKSIFNQRLSLIVKKIKSKFLLPKEYTYTTGFWKINYLDKDQHLKILLFANTKAEGVKLMKDIVSCLEIGGDAPKYNPTFVGTSSSEKQPDEGLRSYSGKVKFIRAEYSEEKGKPLILLDETDK